MHLGGVEETRSRLFLPPGISAHQANALARVSRDTGVTCAVAMNRRHIPLVQTVMQRMRKATRILQVDGVFMKNTDLAHAWKYSSEMHGPGASAFINLGFGGSECEATILYHDGGSMYSRAAAGIGGQTSERIDGKQLAGSEDYHAYYGYKQEDKDFIHAVLGGRRPLCTIQDAVGTMEMIELLLEHRLA